MNAKKQYMVPATEVVDVEVQLMTTVSMGGDPNTPSGPTWGDDNDPGNGTDAGEGW